MNISIRQANSGDTETVSSILQEAARWLEERGVPLWREQELSAQRVGREVQTGLFVLAEVDGEAAATMMFQHQDPEFWPEVPPNESGFVHRLAVRRRYSGGELSSALLQWAVERTRLLGHKYVRLDCVADRPKLRAIYEGFGFQFYSSWQFGPYLVARYQYAVNAPAESALRVNRHADPASFLGRAEPWLMRAEVENNVLLGLSKRLSEGKRFGAAPHYLATVEEHDAVVACAIRTPPHKPVISRGTGRAIKLLLDDILDRYGAFSSILGPEPDVQQFAGLWSARTGEPNRAGARLRLFQIRKPEPLSARAPGHLRPAVESDTEVIARWIAAFDEETGLHEASEPHRIAIERIRQGEMLFVWEDQEVTSMAAASGRTANGIRIGSVYTPPESRRRGYATTCVADLTERLLADGKSYCCLFTDLANPTSNSIYQKIGYRPLCDWSEYRLGA